MVPPFCSTSVLHLCTIMMLYPILPVWPQKIWKERAFLNRTVVFCTKRSPGASMRNAQNDVSLQFEEWLCSVTKIFMGIASRSSRQDSSSFHWDGAAEGRHTFTVGTIGTRIPWMPIALGHLTLTRHGSMYQHIVCSCKMNSLLVERIQSSIRGLRFWVSVLSAAPCRS